MCLQIWETTAAQSQTQTDAQKDIHCIEDSSDVEDDILIISTIKITFMENTFNDTGEEVFKLLEIRQPEKQQKINLKCKIDTGAQSNVLPISHQAVSLCRSREIRRRRQPKSGTLSESEMILSVLGFHNKTSTYFVNIRTQKSVVSSSSRILLALPFLVLRRSRHSS